MSTPFRIIRQESATYPVFAGTGLLAEVASITAEVSKASLPVLISSGEVYSRYGREVLESFRREGSVVETILISEGESNKTVATAEEIVARLLELGAKRDTVALVLGGGMIGDTAGFAASIYLRGIDLIQIPTTLLAQVDSSIGGKVAVNHRKGKNLIGSFHPPRAVISDVGTLRTLPRRELLSGVFEALKGGVIGDAHLFELMESRRDAVLDEVPEVLGEVIRRAIDVKGAIVSADEKEAGLRQLLNYGHTLAHGVETALDYRGITHGEAVAWGMLGANAIARKRGILPEPERQRIDEAVNAYGPAAIPPVDRASMLIAISHDKKFRGGTKVMVLPSTIGECRVYADITEGEIEYGLDAMLDAAGAARG
ncbi:MAG: 3-dehydroquinate synthase [Thermoanaerobaculia bacterium]